LKEVKKDSGGVMIEQIPLGPYKNFSYALADLSSNKAAAIDPAWEVPRIMHFLEKYSLNLIYIINTHVHHDHIEGNEALKKLTGAKVVMSEKSLDIRPRACASLQTIWHCLPVTLCSSGSAVG
jgi:glyoxylase-like metal-dependent hydrolase (beta-lactamase superfamily II)